MDSPFSFVKERLLEMIRNNHFGDKKLYSEEELVNLLNASRATVREVLRSLEYEGLISKKHGIGTFVHPRALQLGSRIDQTFDFIKLIQEAGYIPDMKKDGDPYTVTLRRDNGALRLGGFLEEEEKFYCLNRIYLADNSPVAYCRLMFPERALKSIPSGEVEFRNVFDFLKRYTENGLNHTLISLNAQNADEELSKKLNVKSTNALLVWDELLCDYKDQAIGYSKIYFTPEKLSFNMLRLSDLK